MSKMTTATLTTILFKLALFGTLFSSMNAYKWRPREEYCVKYWEWTINEDMVVNNEQYYGFVLAVSTGTFTLPIYDNMDLKGDPVARLRGSMITDQTGGFTANAALFFYDHEAFLGVHVSYSPDPTLEDDFVYGMTVGGTGPFRYFNAAITTAVVAESPKFIVEWTFCY